MQKRAEEAGEATFLSEKKLFEAIFRHATEGIILCDKHGIIKIANEAACHQFGYRSEELEGQMIEMLIPVRYRHSHMSYRREYEQHPQPRPMGQGRDLYGLRKDGSEFPVEVSLSPARIDNEDMVIAFTIDITYRKQQERLLLQKQQELETITQKLKQTNEQLEKKVADRTQVLQEALMALEKSKNELQTALAKERELNELKSRFLSMASHEFRTPLTAILSSASLIADYTEAEHQEKRLRHVQRITNAVNSLNDILNDFLSLSKIEEGKVSAQFKPFSITLLLAEIEAELKAMLKKDQQLIVSHQGSDDMISDRRLVRQIMVNLLSNAIKYSKEASPVKLETCYQQNALTITVTDQGIGISPEDQKHLFERFFRGSNAGNVQGTGLGLNIVKGYVQLLGGTIDFKSELNKGTIFLVTLPDKNPNS
jgi:PAS domain S-box-containing protein